MKNKISLLVVFLIAVLMVGCGSMTPEEGDRVFECNYHCISLTTKIDVAEDDTDNNYRIQGEFFRRFVEDLVIEEDEKVFLSKDQYNLISQNDHIIYVDGEKEIEMIGHFTFFGDSYTIKVDEEEIAKASFNFFNTYGELEDMEGDILATYHSGLIRKDYTVCVKENCHLDEKVVNLIFASYVSDYQSDHMSVGGSSKKSK